MSRNVGGYLVELLAANDIETVFGIPGVHNLELYRGLASANLHHVLMRHEQGAGFAADGYARLSGRAAAAFVISGPGLTNILTAAAQAYSDSVPLLVIASAPVRASQGKQRGVLHELKDQTGLAAQVFGIARAAHTANDIADDLRQCLNSLRTGRPRPAYLEVPLDLLSQPTLLQAQRFELPARNPQADAEQIGAAARLLAVAARPLIIAGGGARHAGAALHRLVDLLDCPLITTTAGKGLLPDVHPNHFGASLAYESARRLIADADVVVAVGTELAETDIFFEDKLSLSGLLIRIDIDPAKLSDHYAADVALWADARHALESLSHALATAVTPSAAAAPRRGWRSELGGAERFRAEISAGMDSQSRAAVSALNAIKTALPWDGVVFTDMTQIAYTGNYAYPVEQPGQWFHPSGYGTLGYALPAAIGAKISSPRRAVLALAGDFGAQFTLSELMTAVEANLSLPVVIWNNGALGQIRDDMLTAGIPLTGVIARNPDFVGLAKACGAAACRVHDAAALAEAIRAALHTAGPTLIEAVAGSF